MTDQPTKPLTAWAEKMLRELDDADLRDMLHRQGPATVHHLLATIDSLRAAVAEAEKQRDELRADLRDALADRAPSLMQITDEVETLKKALTKDRDALASELAAARKVVERLRRVESAADAFIAGLNNDECTNLDLRQEHLETVLVDSYNADQEAARISAGKGGHRCKA